MKMRWLFKLGLLVGVGAAAIGCAEEREPINRVESMALPKTFFVGDDIQDPSDDPEFYTQAFIIDVPYGVGDGLLWTVGFGGLVARVRFEISQSFLIARISYERINDSDATGLDPAKKDGVIAGIWRIRSHFDIRRGYNPQTGEQMNIIEENQSDRSWFEREYIRVDWSTNLNTDSYDFDILSWIGIQGGHVFEPVAYEINDPSHPHAPHFSLEQGYFDIVNKAFAQPQMVDLSHLGWGIDKFPACWLPNDFFHGSDPVGSCNPIEVTIRQSFLRITDTDYEPAHWDGQKFAAYGAFYTDRYGASRHYGMRDEKWQRLINRFNIWERSHYYDDLVNMEGAITCGTPEMTGFGGDVHADFDENGTEDQCWEVAERLRDVHGIECDGGLCEGSRCDEFTNKCTLPYRARNAKPLAWYLTVPGTSEARFDANGNPDIFEADGTTLNPEKEKKFFGDMGVQMMLRYYEPTEWSALEWDTALRQAVQTARYAECRKTGGDPETCFNNYPTVMGQQQDNMDMVQLVREMNACVKKSGYAEGAVATCKAQVEGIGADRRYSAGVIGTVVDERVPKMVAMCHSPVRVGDDPLCGAPGTFARMGDMRYHQVNVIPQPQSPSPWGIMVSSIDPKTGEQIMMSANVFGQVTDFWAQRAVDYVRYIKGELSVEDVTDAKYVTDWIRAEQVSRTGGGGIMPQYTEQGLTQLLADAAGVDFDTMANVRTNWDSMKNTKGYAAVHQLDQMLRGVQASIDAPVSRRAITGARIQAAANTEFEAQLVSKPVLQRAGSVSADPGMMDFVSPLRMNNPQHEMEFKRMKEVALANRNMCVLDAEAMAPEGTSMAALADVLFDRKFSMDNVANLIPDFNDLDDRTRQIRRAEMVREFVARRSHYNVITHEIGHAIGLRHNFVGSSDATIFRPQYWQLRTKNGKVTTQCTRLNSNGEDCIGPRYFDPITPNEDSQLIHMFAHGSIMDYGGNTEVDLNGLAVHDFAAARMFYGETVAVYADDDVKLGAPFVTRMRKNDKGEGKEESIGLAGAVLAKMDNFGGITGMKPEVAVKGSRGPSTESYHYSSLDYKFGLLRDCYNVDNVGVYEPSDWNNEVDGPWDPLLDGHIVQVDGSYSRCGERPVDHVFWSELRHPNVSELNAVSGSGKYFYRGGPGVDPQDRLRVPYGFATDSWADLGNLSVYRHDLGADPYELFQFFISQQELGHIWSAYRRGRQAFSVRSVSGNIFDRYNAKMRDGAKGLGLYKTMFREMAVLLGYDYNKLTDAQFYAFFEDNVLASAMAFDHFARQYQRPHIGFHFTMPRTRTLKNPDKNISELDVWMAEDDAVASPEDNAERIVIPNGAAGSKYRNDVSIGGHLVNNALAEDQGEFDRDYTMNAGSYYDKIYAPILFAESVDNFISASRNDFVDPRYRSVALADVFPDGYRRFVGNMLTNDNYIKALRLTADAKGKPLTTNEGGTIVDPWKPGVSGKFIADPIVWTSWWPSDGPQSCVPSEGTWACIDPAGRQGVNPSPRIPEKFALLDSQVGWEQKKHLIAQTMLYLPENQHQWWLEQMRVYDLSRDVDPKFTTEVRFTNPLSGKHYVAKSYGKELIFGKKVEKGIAARVLEFANELVGEAFYVYDNQVDAYQKNDPNEPNYLEPEIFDALAPDQDHDGIRDWPTVAYDKVGAPAVRATLYDEYNRRMPDCNPLDPKEKEKPWDQQCVAASCSSNNRCVELESYIEVIFFLRQALDAYRLTDMSQRGIY